jgi:hypothetical protein
MEEGKQLTIKQEHVEIKKLSLLINKELDIQLQ